MVLSCLSVRTYNLLVWGSVVAVLVRPWFYPLVLRGLPQSVGLVTPVWTPFSTVASPLICLLLWWILVCRLRTLLWLGPPGVGPGGLPGCLGLLVASSDW